jgi:hypothetical protein
VKSEIILSHQQLLAAAPSIFAKKPWKDVSDRYAFIPTIDVVKALAKEGFHPVRAHQSNVMTKERRAYTKHMLRFRHEDDLERFPKAFAVDGHAHHFFKRGEAPELVEVILTNAHDRTAMYTLDAGLFRLVCSNGLVMKSSDFGSIHIRHSGDVIGDVQRGSQLIVARAPKIRQQVKLWRAIQLNEHQRLLLASAAVHMRYGSLKASPILPQRLLDMRRPEDDRASLWITMNVIQENLMRGNLAGMSSNGRRIRTRGINSVGTEMAINRNMWALAETMAEEIN